MIQNPFIKLSLYDQFGYLLVGGISLMVMIFDAKLFGMEISAFQFDSFLVAFLLSYFFGHVMQAVSNIFVKEDKDSYLETEKKVLDRVKTLFKLEVNEYKELYNNCYMLALAHDLTGHVATFNAAYSLYRGWFVIFLLEAIFLIFYSLIVATSPLIIVLIILSLFFCLLFYTRLKRFFQYGKAKTLQTFLLYELANTNIK